MLFNNLSNSKELNDNVNKTNLNRNWFIRNWNKNIRNKKLKWWIIKKIGLFFIYLNISWRTNYIKLRIRIKFKEKLKLFRKDKK